MKKIILVDGNNLLFRSYYATSYSGVIMHSSKGFPTNALYGFINMMNKIIQEENPNYIMVAFDKGKTFRHEKYDSYKAGRIETPDELKRQFPKAKEILDAMGISHFEIDGYEADDIIGTLAKQVDLEDEFIATIISSDKDLLQLISDDVTVKLLKQTGSIQMDEKEFINTYGVKPIRMIDLKALMGDPSDHIPGVKGIGEKTAINLLKQYDTLDNLYDHIEEVKGKVKEKLIDDKENAYMSLDLATIYREVPLPFQLEDLVYKGWNLESYVALLEEFEFHSLLKKIDRTVLTSSKQEEVGLDREEKLEVIIVQSWDTLAHLSDCAFFLEVIGTNYHKAHVLGIGLYDGVKNYYIPASLLQTTPPVDFIDHLKYTYDLKKAIVILNTLGIQLNEVSFDTMIATYLLNYNVKDDIAYVAQAFDYKIPFYDDMYGTEKRPKKVEEEKIFEMACQKAKFIYETRENLLKQLKEEDELVLFEEVEMPLAKILSDMEMTGICVDRAYLVRMGEELKAKIDKLAEEIYELAGVEFNILSPKQLGEVLFDRMAIPYPKKIKDQNYSTSKDILDKIIFYHPIVSQILEYRTLSKLYTNYAIGLVSEIREDGKIHTIYNQTLTRTGRLSSVSPNLQNIPARLEYGRLIRKAFVPSQGCLLLSSDYSQIELRMFAHMSGAENLIQAFVLDKDIHSQTASDIFGVPLEEVTSSMRRTAKAVNFGILYGISSFGLSEDLGIDVKSAKEFIQTYLNTYPGIQEYMDLEIKEAYRNGFVKTIMNRKRTIEELKNKNYMIRSQGERMALNTPIQGSGADILKKAMVLIDREFQKRNLKSKMLLQVHDELVFDVLKTELEEVKAIVKDIMEHVIVLRVPLKVEIATGENWYEAK